MKVLIAHARYAQPGGEEAVVDAQEQALLARGHEVVRYEVANDGRSRLQLALDSLWSVRAARAIGAVVDDLRPDVLHVHNNFHQLSPSIYAPADRRRVGVVQHLHNSRLACINAFFERDGASCTDCVGRSVSWPGVVHRCYRGSQVESVAATGVQLTHRVVGARRRVDRFVAVSDALRTALVAAGVVPHDTTAVCHNGVTAPSSTRVDQGYALYVGRVAPEKGIQVLLDAAASVPELPVRIAGDGPARAGYEDQARRRGLRHVQFLGRLDATALAQQRSGARVAVTPSIGFDPLPTVVIESAGAGVATIGSDIGGIPEIVGDTGELVPAGDAAALASALRRAYDDPARLAAMGEAARARYLTTFTLDSFGARLEAIYAEVVQGL